MIETTEQDLALDYFSGNELAATVWKGKYALKKDGELIETDPLDTHVRMAAEFARIEAKYEGKHQLTTIDIVQSFDKFEEIIPQGSVMSQLGNKNSIGSLSNCIVIPEVYDSYGGIMFADQQLSQLMKRRCGVGVDISTLRPAGSVVSNAAQSSTGAVSFMHRFSHTTREVAQDGRRGALMISLDIRHPEAEQFATIKEDLTKVTGANISLKLTDDFMEAVEKKELFDQRFPVNIPSLKNTFPKLELREGETWKGTGSQYIVRDANKLWNKIVGAAHKSAEPGLIFWDRQHWYSPSSVYPEFENISTNPCSEIAMGNDSCRLIAANMFSCVVKPFTKLAYFDFEKWYSVNYKQMRLMDDLVDLELEHVDRILNKIKEDREPDHIKAIEIKTWEDLRKNGQRGRRTGAGFTALGDTLAALGLKYDSDKALETVDNIMEVKLEAELNCTIDMAEERGAFPAFDAALEAAVAERKDTFFYFIKEKFPAQWKRMQEVGRRNVSWSTVAPTGSLSLLAGLGKGFHGTTSGIEPLFAIYYIRRKKINPNDKEARVDFVDKLGDKWQEFPVFHEGFKMWWVIASQYEHNPKEGIRILENMSKEDLAKVIAESPYAGSTAPEINWKKRVQMQGIIQKYITHSISSTINLPEDVKTDEVSEIYFESWKAGLKGITVYRDGSRSGVLVTSSNSGDSELVYHDAPKRPKSLDAECITTRVKGNQYAVIIGFLNDKPYEVFAFSGEEEDERPTNGKGTITKVKKGSYSFTYTDGKTIDNVQNRDAHADEQMLTRLVSGMMRHGVNPKFIIEQIDKCPLEIVSFGKALSRIIKRYVPENELLDRFKCTECGSKEMLFEEGCKKCKSCGHAACG